MGSLHSKPLHGLELISFSTIFHSTFFSVTYKYFMFFFFLFFFFAFQNLAQIGAGCFLTTNVAMATLCCILNVCINIFTGSLYFIPLHGLELISFLAIPGNKCCHGNTVFLFLGLLNNFMGFWHSIPLHGLELIIFSAVPGNCCCGNTFFLFLGCGFKKF